MVAAARHIISPHAQISHRPHQRAHRQRRGAARQVDHWRRQHDPVEPALTRMRDAQEHRAAHGMGERKMRRRAVGQHHLLYEGLDVDLVIGKVSHVALARIAQAPRGVALPAPVDHGNREAAVAQIAHGLEILLDLLAAPGEDADSALAAHRRRPACKAQLRAVGRLDGAADQVFRNGIGGNRDQRHELLAIGETVLEIKGCAE